MTHVFINKGKSRLFAIAISIALSLSLASCSQNKPMPMPAPKPPAADPVGVVSLKHSASEPTQNQLLDVGVVVFRTNTVAPEAERAGDRVFNEIKRKEVHYLPYALRNTLIESNQWGAVRVLPEHDPSLDLQLSAEILRSDGFTLELQVVATDSTGHEWLNKIYADVANTQDYPTASRFTAWDRFDPDSFVDPFQDIYDQIANDLVTARATLSDPQLVTIDRVSELVYANDLAPATFRHTLARGEDGLLSVTSLLARDDPMLARVNEMRARHLVFIDTVDEYYDVLFQEMQPTYVVWRRYSLDQVLETQTAAKKSYDPDDYGKSDNFLTFSQRYDRFKWSKIYEQEFAELAAGFNSEVAPAMLELNQRVYGLTGNMDDQYRQWRQILRSLFAIETGQDQP